MQPLHKEGVVVSQQNTLQHSLSHENLKFLSSAILLKSQTHLSMSAVVIAGTSPRHMSSKSSSTMSKSNLLLELYCEWECAPWHCCHCSCSLSAYRFELHEKPTYYTLSMPYCIFTALTLGCFAPSDSCSKCIDSV